MLRHRRLLVALVLVAYVLASCGEPGPAELVRRAEAALLAGEHPEALALYERALARLDAREPEYVPARLGAIKARIPLDAERAKDEFLRLADQLPAAIDARRYCHMAGLLADVEGWEPALAILDVGLERFGEHESKLTQLRERVEECLPPWPPETSYGPAIHCEF